MIKFNHPNQTKPYQCEFVCVSFFSIQHIKNKKLWCDVDNKNIALRESSWKDDDGQKGENKTKKHNIMSHLW